MQDFKISKNEEGIAVVGSRAIAEGFGKEHRDVLGKIRSILGEREYSLSSYRTTQGKELPEYLLPKNSFILLVMNYDGFNDFKRAYIEAFDTMEKKLLAPKIPQNYKEALLEVVKLIDEKEQLQLENTTLKPKANFYDQYLDAEGHILFNDALCKLNIQLSNIKLNKYLNITGLINKPHGKWRATNEGKKLGIFALKEYPVNESGLQPSPTLVFNHKGLVWLYEHEDDIISYFNIRAVA